MPYLGNSHIAGDQINNFKVLDDISSHTSTFDGSASGVVSTSDNTIRIVEHRFLQGQRVTYNNGGGGNIGNLSSGTAYYIIKDTNNTIKLATSLSDANNSTAINLSVLGSGSSHTLNVAFDGVNTKFKVTHNGGTPGRINNATQLSLAINNVIQRPNQNAATFTEGFAIEDQHKIVFKVAPASSDIFWGSILANTLPTFDISDNKIDNFTGDGSTTEFNLSNIPASNKSIMVTINGVLQHPSDGSTSRSYTLLSNILQFTAAPGNGDEIQVRHIGFAGATTSDVTGFYGRTGNVVLTSNDHITTGNINAGVVTATSFVGNLTGNVSGNLTVGGVLTYEDVTNVDSIGIVTARSGFKVLAGGANVVGVITARTDVHLEDYIYHLGDLNTKIGFPAADTITAETSGSERLRIMSGGNIGIRTTTGTNTVNIGGVAGLGVKFHNFTSGNSSYITVESGDKIQSNVGGTGYFTWVTGGSEKFRITSDGKVAIGTDAASTLTSSDDLTISTSGSTGITLFSAIGNAGNIAFGDGTSGDDRQRGLLQYHHSDNTMRFFTNAARRMTIASDGKVGISSDAPAARLDILARGDTEKGIRLLDSNNAQSAPYIEVIGKRSDGNGSQGFGGKIHLAKNRTDAKINNGNIIGSVAFGGNHTDGTEANILYTASISAVASDSFDSATDMPTDLIFLTGITGKTPTAVNTTTGTERLRIDSDGQIGIGNIVPDTWSTGKSITIGTAQATLWGVGDQVNLSGNAYFNSGWKAAASKAGASQIEQALGNIDFKVSGSVTADNSITWINALRIKSDGVISFDAGTTAAITPSQTTASQIGDDTLTGGTDWFDHSGTTDYFGIDGDHKLTNGTTYGKIVARNASDATGGTAAAAGHTWYLISKTVAGTMGQNDWRVETVAGWKMAWPTNLAAGATTTFYMKDAVESYGSPTIPATGDYYISWYFSPSQGRGTNGGSYYTDASSGGNIYWYSNNGDSSNPNQRIPRQGDAWTGNALGDQMHVQYHTLPRADLSGTIFTSPLLVDPVIQGTPLMDGFPMSGGQLVKDVQWHTNTSSIEFMNADFVNCNYLLFYNLSGGTGNSSSNSWYETRMQFCNQDGTYYNNTNDYVSHSEWCDSTSTDPTTNDSSNERSGYARSIWLTGNGSNYNHMGWVWIIPSNFRHNRDATISQVWGDSTSDASTLPHVMVRGHSFLTAGTNGTSYREEGGGIYRGTNNIFDLSGFRIFGAASSNPHTPSANGSGNGYVRIYRFRSGLETRE